ncbi:hypothetical protein Tco_0743415 [Tanacetum coccineum]
MLFSYDCYVNDMRLVELLTTLSYDVSPLMNIRDIVPPLRRPDRPRSQSNVMLVHPNVRPCFTPNNDVRNTSPTLTPAVMLSLETVVDNNGNAVHQTQSYGVLNPSHPTRSANHANVLNTPSSTCNISHLTNVVKSDTDLHTSVYRDARQHRRMRQYVDSGDATYTCVNIVSCEMNF